MDTYFSTRSLARIAAKETGGKVLDNGKDAPTGKRWQVIPGYVVEAVQDTAKQRAEMENKPVITLSIGKRSNVANQARKALYYAINYARNNKTVPVYHKRSFKK